MRYLFREIQYEGNDETTRSVHTLSFKSLPALYTRGQGADNTTIVVNRFWYCQVGATLRCSLY